MGDRENIDPKDLLEIFENPKYQHEKHCWDLNICNLLARLNEKLNSTESNQVDFSTSSLILQGAIKIYCKRLQSLDKDVCSYHSHLSEYVGFLEDIIPEQDGEAEDREVGVQQETVQQKQDATGGIAQPIVEEICQHKKNQKKNETVEENAETVAINQPRKLKSLSSADLNNYLDNLWQQTFGLHRRQYNENNVEESEYYRRMPIFTTIDKHQRRKCCEILLKYLKQTIPLLNVIQNFLDEEHQDFNSNNVGKSEICKSYDFKRFVAAKMMLLVDIRNKVFIPNFLQSNTVQIRLILEEFIIDEIVRYSDIYDTPKSVRESEDSSHSLAKSVYLPSECRVVVVPLQPETVGIQLHDSVSEFTNFSTVNNSSSIVEKDMEIEQQAHSTLNGNKISMGQQQIDLNKNDMEIEEVNLSATQQQTVHEGSDADESSENLMQEETESESLLIDCEAIRECQDSSITINKVHFNNMFGFSKRLLRKSCYFRLTDDILEWARIHLKVDLISNKHEKSSRPQQSKSTIRKHQQILKIFISKNKSRLNKNQMNRLQSRCYIPLVLLSQQPEILPVPDVDINNSEDKLTEVQNIEPKVNHESSEDDTQFSNITVGIPNINDSLLLTQQNLEHLESTENCEDIETASYKTLTQDSNVESGIFTDIMASRDNTPSCTTRNNSFFSDLQDDDLTNMTASHNDTTNQIVNIDRTFNRLDSSTQQFENVPEGNVLNKIAETMQLHQGDEKEYLEMINRVEKWHENMRGKLLQAKRRENWDIHAYEDCLLDRLPTKPEEIHLSLVVDGQSKEEICRDFLAILNLATEGNIEIIKTNQSPNAVNNITLSRNETITRNHENMMASLERMSINEETPLTFDESHTNQSVNETVKTKKPFLYRIYGQTDDDTSDNEISNFSFKKKKLLQKQKMNDDDSFDSPDTDHYINRSGPSNIDHMDNCNVKPPLQTPKRRGRKLKVPKPTNIKNIYKINNETYDSSDLDDYVARVVQSVNAFEDHNRQPEQQNEEVVDLPIILSTPSTSERVYEPIKRRKVQSTSLFNIDDSETQPGPSEVKTHRQRFHRTTFHKHLDFFDDSSSSDIDDYIHKAEALKKRKNNINACSTPLTNKKICGKRLTSGDSNLSRINTIGSPQPRQVKNTSIVDNIFNDFDDDSDS